MIIRNTTYHNSLASISDTEKGAAILIVNIIALIISVASVAVRFFISKRKGAGYRPARDDLFCYASLILSCALFGVFWKSVFVGNGKTIKDISGPDLIEVQRLQYAIELLSLVAIFCSRASVIFLIQRLQGASWDWPLRTTFTSLIVWVVVSIFIVVLKCDPDHPWIEYNVHCTGLLARWVFIEVFGIAIEACIFGLVISIIYHVHFGFSSKLKVISLFGTRVLVLVFAGLRLGSLSPYYHSSDATLAAALANVYLLAEVHASIITATTPLLKSFFLEFKVVGQRQSFLPRAKGGSHGFSSPKGPPNESNNSTVPLEPIRIPAIIRTRRKKVRIVDQDPKIAEVLQKDIAFSAQDGGPNVPVPLKRSISIQ